MLVIKFKDIIKYLACIILIISVFILIARYFFNLNKEKKFINKTALTECLGSVIPEVSETDEREEKEETKTSGITKILEMELGYIKLKKEDNTQAETPTSNKKLEEAQTGVDTEVVDSGIENKFTNTYGSVQIKNGTKYDLTEDILTPNFELTNKKDIIIYHTHTCESYTPTENYNYEQTGTYRTTDLNYTVARVGDELTDYLTNYGYNVVHDKTYHDYPAYTGSYSRSMDTITNIMNNGTNAQMIIDLHRDAVGSNSNYAPKVKIGEEYAAQLMFVIGTDGGGMEHPNWQRNLKFAVAVQQKANEMYPGLFKPIILRNSRYNQNVSDAATIIEVGATGNTMEECLTSMKYLSKVFSEIVK